MNGRAVTLLVGTIACVAGTAAAIPALTTAAPRPGVLVGVPQPGPTTEPVAGTRIHTGPPIQAGAGDPGRTAPAYRLERAVDDDSRPAATAGDGSFANLAFRISDEQLSGLSPEVLHLAVSAVSCAVNSGEVARPKTLTVIDYSLPSVEPRLWVFDVDTGNLLFRELVAHGRNTGENMATQFSDIPESRQSSIGLFRTGETYVGANGYSLRMDGLEPGFNARARERAIVMHGAPYVDETLARTQGRLGRSWGCPALREAVARDVIDTIRGGGVVFSYYPEQKWLETSRFLNCANAERLIAKVESNE